MEDYINELSLTQFFIKIHLEQNPLLDKTTSVRQLDAMERQKIKDDNVSNERKKLKRLLKGFGMEGLWDVDEYKQGNRKMTFPPYILLLFRRMLLSDMKGTLIGKISKVQRANEKGLLQESKDALLAITDEDIESFTNDLGQDYDGWTRAYLEHHEINGKDYENWVKEVDQRTERGTGDGWFELGEWYDQHRNSKMKEGPSKPGMGDSSQDQEDKRQWGQGPRFGEKAEKRPKASEKADAFFEKMASMDPSVFRERDTQTDSIPDGTLARMLELRAEEINMSRMLEEVECLLRQKRTLRAIQEKIHGDLDEVIQRIYGLETITEQQFEVLVPHEIRTPDEGWNDNETMESHGCFINMPMISLRAGDREKAGQEEGLRLTNEHKMSAPRCPSIPT